MTQHVDNFTADYPDVWLASAEKRELIRIAAVSALERSRGGRDLIPEARAWAEHWAAQKPLGRPLSDGSTVLAQEKS